MSRASWGRSLLKTSINLVEAGLLLKEIPSGGFGGFFFQSEVHAFMATVLLRMARLDALDADPET